MDTFEIIVFENQNVYDKIECERHDVVNKFVNKYYHYFDPHHYTEDSIRFDRGKLYLRYSEAEGGYKPTCIMLIGPITEFLISEVKEGVKEMYESSF